MLVLGSQSKFLDVDLSVRGLGHTLSAIPSDKKVQFHANTCMSTLLT